MIKKIILVFKTHFDIGFTDLASNVISQYAGTMLDQVLDTCGVTEDMGKLKYVWTMPAWPLKVVIDSCTPKRKERLEHFIENGQVAWHALPFTSHTDFCGEEEYLESLRYAKELSDRYKKPYPVAAKMTDVPGHGRMLPEILGASGIRFLHLGCNAFATPPKVPDLFWWEAPSGRKVLTMYCRGGYGSSLEAPKDWEFPVWMSLVHTHDNCGPHSAEFIRELEREARKLYPEADIVCGTMDDFYRELESSDLSRIPVVDKDLADTWIHGIGAYPREVAQIRSFRHKSTAIQKWASCLPDTPMEQEKNKELLNQYYENMHLFGEHTWGADVKTWLGEKRVYERQAFENAKKDDRYRFMERSWEEQSERATGCEEALEQLKENLWKKGNNGFLLYNHSSRPFQGWFALDRESDTTYDILVDEVKLPRTEIFGRDMYYAEHLESLSATTARRETTLKTGVVLEQEAFSQGKIKSKVLKISEDGEISSAENHRYILRFNRNTGNILELVDKKLNKTLLKEAEGTGVFSYQYTRHGMQKMTEFLRAYGYRFSTWGIQDYGRENYPECEDETYCPVFEAIKIERDKISFFYRGTGTAYGDAEEIRIDVTLPETGDEVYVALNLSEKGETPFLESGSFCMPLEKGSKEYLINKNGMCINPKRDIADNANHVFYAVEEFAAADDGKTGICIMPMDTPLLSIGEDGIYTYRSKYQEKKNIFFFNAFNNMWGTNFPQWQGGDYTYRFVLWGYEEKEKLYARSILLSEGILSLEGDIRQLHASSVKIPESLQLLNRRLDGEEELLICREITGKAGHVQIEAPGYIIWETDYFGRMQGESQSDVYELDCKKYGLHLFKIKRLQVKQK